MPLIIGVVVVVVLGLVFFMQGDGDKTAKKAGDSAEPIVIPTHNWSSQVVICLLYTSPSPRDRG